MQFKQAMQVLSKETNRNYKFLQKQHLYHQN